MGKTYIAPLCVLVTLLASSSAIDHLPSIKEMVDEWDARMAARAAGVQYSAPQVVVTDPGQVPLNADSQEQRERRQTRIGQLEGTYVAECQQNSSWFGGSSLMSVAQATTTQYNVSSQPRSIDDTNGTFEVDYTEYVGYSCQPGSGGFDKDAFAKYNIRGQIAYHGHGVGQFNTSYQAEWIISQSDWILPDDTTTDPYVTRLVDILNDQCPCGGTWKKGTIGARTIRAHQCHRDHITPQSFSLCAIIGGLPTYALYRYTSNPSVVQYISSPVQFDQIAGWTTQQPSSDPRSQLPQTDVHYPEACSGLLALECGVKDGVLEDISNNCQGCARLECAGCAFRYMNNSKDVSSGPTYWSSCCPCAWYLGQHRGEEWMQYDC